MKSTNSFVFLNNLSFRLLSILLNPKSRRELCQPDFWLKISKKLSNIKKLKILNLNNNYIYNNLFNFI